MKIAIGFDFDHTLAIDNKLERTALLELAKELGVVIGATDMARLAQIDTLLQEMRMDKLTLEQMIARFVHSIKKDHKSHGLLHRFKEICYALLPHHVVAVAGANQMLSELDRRDIPHAILTNGWSPLQEKKAAAIHYDGKILVSGKMGVAKPSLEAYAKLKDVFPSDACIWYVGDNPSTDVRGALDAGYEAIWYHEHAGLPYPSHLPPPSAIIDGLPDLIPLVDNAHADGKPGRAEAMPNPV
ncbi:MAG: HAD family hydrolase [Candidatus Eremiobacteraeota bacterium]|nr:HAD family hydrolase [Candidatus Eremiobacteraeota bacterium]